MHVAASVCVPLREPQIHQVEALGVGCVWRSQQQVFRLDVAVHIPACADTFVSITVQLDSALCQMFLFWTATGLWSAGADDGSQVTASESDTLVEDI